MNVSTIPSAADCFASRDSGYGADFSRIRAAR